MSDRRDVYMLDMLRADAKRLREIRGARALTDHELIALRNFDSEIERLERKSQEAGHG